MKQQFEIVTISKAKFDKLPKGKKAMAIAQDVIDRIKLNQLIPITGHFCRKENVYDLNWEKLDGLTIKEQLKSPKLKCEVCAKGSLFLSFVGISNNYDKTIQQIGNGEYDDGLGVDDTEMKILQVAFTAKQLNLIEVAYESSSFSWTTLLSDNEIKKCIKFGHKNGYKHHSNGNNDALLIAICKNIIKNKGQFNP